MAWALGWTAPALDWPAPGAMVAGLLLAPVLEEIVFRGGLQEGLLRVFPSARCGTANLLTSLAFALVHVLCWQTWRALAVFFPSLVIGALYTRCRRLGPVIGLHLFYNALWLFLSTGPT